MAFKFSNSRDKVRLECEAIIPNDRGGEAKHKFYAEFRVPSASERQQLREEVREGAEFADILPRWLTGWDLIYGDDDQPIEFSEENVERVISDIYLCDGMSVAFAEYLYDRHKARRKN